MSGNPCVSDSAHVYADGGCAPLSAAEESLLAARVLAGDAEARDAMVRSNLRMVTRIARGYVGRGLPLDDLIAEGTIGLIRAVDNFDPTTGVRFANFGWVWIKQTIRSAIYNTAATIRIPVPMCLLLSKWRWAEITLTNAIGRKPADDAIAEFLGLTAEAAAKVVAASVVKLAERNEQRGWTLEGAAVDRSRPTDDADDAMDAERELARVRDAMGGLKPRESAILRMRYGLDGGEGETFVEIGRRYGVTSERVRQIEARAMRKLRDGVKWQKSDRRGITAAK